jgi:hypothetical protein
MTEQHHVPNNGPRYDDDPACPFCFRNISADRPPILSPENCSCIDTTMDGGPGRQETFEQPSYSPESYASSGRSVPCPEGPENHQPNITTKNHYLPLGPSPGLNEREHRRSSSFKSDMSYQLRRFLIEDEEYDHMPVQMEREARCTKFLQQDVQLSVSMAVAKSSKKSGKSMESGKSEGKDRYVWIGHGGAEMVGLGAWDEEIGLGILGEGGYPMAMSGLSEVVFE